MSFPPPPPPSSQSSIASGSDKISNTRPSRQPQSPWGQPSQSQSSRRGLTPLSTNLSSIGSGIRRLTASSSPGPQNSTNSPLTTPFSAVLGSTNRLVGSRNPSSASQSSFNSLQAGSFQGQFYQSSQNSSSRPRANTPGPAPHLASSNHAISTSTGGGGGVGSGGGTSSASRSAAYSPALSSAIGSPTNFTFDKSSLPTSSSAGGSSSGSSLSKISVAQVLLLVDTINDKEGRAKWDSKADQIRKVSQPFT